MASLSTVVGKNTSCSLITFTKCNLRTCLIWSVLKIQKSLQHKRPLPTHTYNIKRILFYKLLWTKQSSDAHIKTGISIYLHMKFRLHASRSLCKVFFTSEHNSLILQALNIWLAVYLQHKVPQPWKFISWPKIN